MHEKLLDTQTEHPIWFLGCFQGAGNGGAQEVRGEREGEKLQGRKESDMVADGLPVTAGERSLAASRGKPQRG